MQSISGSQRQERGRLSNQNERPNLFRKSLARWSSQKTLAHLTSQVLLLVNPAFCKGNLLLTLSSKFQKHQSFVPRTIKLLEYLATSFWILSTVVSENTSTGRLKLSRPN